MKIFVARIAASFALALSAIGGLAPVPPGKYTIEIEKQKTPLDLAEGQEMEINLK